MTSLVLSDPSSFSHLCSPSSEPACARFKLGWLVQDWVFLHDPMSDPLNNLRSFDCWQSELFKELAGIPQESGLTFFSLKRGLYPHELAEFQCGLSDGEDFWPSEIQNSGWAFAQGKEARQIGIGIPLPNLVEISHGQINWLL